MQFRKRRHPGSKKSLNPKVSLRFINLKISYDKGVLLELYGANIPMV